MKFRESPLVLVVALLTLAQRLPAQQADLWRTFTKADGLADNACVSVTLGAGGNVFVRHANTSAISVFDGYEITTLSGPGTNLNRVYESPGGQLWTVAPEGLQEFHDGEWRLYRVAEVADHFRAGRTNEVPLLPVRQGRVLILLPDRLLQLDAEDPGHAKVELLRYADQTSLGAFAAMIPAHDGGLWISGARGFSKIAGPLRNLKADDTWVVTDETPPDVKSRDPGAVSYDELAVRKVFDVAVEPSGAYWLATSDGLFRHAPSIWKTPDATDIASPVESRVTPAAKAVDVTKVLKIADQTPGGKSPQPASGETSDATIARANWKTFLIAKNGDVWLGDANEIAWRHQNSWHIFSSTNLIGPENVTAFAEAPDGRIRCATLGKVWEFDGKNWLALRSGFGRINALLCSRDGTLWVATDDGLSRSAQSAWIANSVEDGLPSKVVRDVAEDSLGRIRADTSLGPSLFQPDADTDPPRTFIHAPTNAAGKFREGTPVTVSFSGRDKWKVTDARRLLFSYRLDEHEWSPFQELSEISFSDLALGKHYFQVRGMDRNGNIDPKPARLEFAVVVPWYRETRLVLILVVALAVAVFFAALAVNRHRRLQLSYAEVERKIAQRTRELEIANRELLHSQKMNALGTLAAGIAHDFNNILSIIKGSAQIIEDNLDNPEKVGTRLDRIKTVVEQGSGIVKAMLGFSSSDQQPGRCDLNAVVDDTVKLLGDRFLREVEVSVERKPNLPEVSAAKDFVQQILLNFIFNAAESMTNRKLVTLSTQRLDKLPTGVVLMPAQAAVYATISVRDSGCGISPENLPRIFEPFFTTKAMSTRRGTGLGLSMVYELAKKMSAGLAVESKVEQGSTFTLILPVRDLPANASP